MDARAPEHRQTWIPADLANQPGLSDPGLAVKDDRSRTAARGIPQYLAEELLFGSAPGESVIGSRTPHVYSVNTLRRVDGRIKRSTVTSLVPEASS